MDLSRFLPSLVASVPRDGDRSVPLNTSIELEFSVPLHPDVLTTAEISKHVMLLEAVTERSMPVTLDAPSATTGVRKIVLRPTAPLQPETDYLFVVLPTLPAYTGRTAGVRRVIGFRTAAAGRSIPAPVPTTPAHNARLSQLPVQLSWTGWQSPPAGGTVLYEVELARDERFVDTVWQSVGAATTVSVPEQHTPVGDYAWRVRALFLPSGSNTAEPGPWSPVVFFVVRSGTASVEPSPTDGYLLTTSIDGQATAVLSRWPDLVLYGVPEGYESIGLEWRDADGYPSWDWRTAQIRLVAQNLQPGDGIIDRVQVILEEDIGLSRIYRLTLRVAGRVVWERMFYLNLRPMYCHPDVVRYRIGGLADSEDLDDDDICFYIFRKSLEANRHFYRYVWSGWAGPPESTIRSLDVGNYFAVQRWVELQATIEILSQMLLRLSARMGVRQRLGDYSDDHEANALREIRELRRQLQKESILWLSEFSKLRAVAMSASKGSLNPAYLPGGAHEYPRRDWRRSDRWRE